MVKEEVVPNLWYVMDDDGFIHHLLGRTYVANGSDSDKLAFLHERALLDWKIAESFPVPGRYRIFLAGTEEALHAIHASDLKNVGYNVLFREVMDELEKRLGVFGGLKIPLEPLLVVTPVRMKDDNTFEITANMKLDKI